MCICLKISHRDWVTARHTSACITVLYVDFNFTRTETATMTDYRQLYSVTGELRKLPQQQNSGSHSICKCDATYSGGIVDFVRDGLNLLRATGCFVSKAVKCCGTITQFTSPKH